MPTPSVQVFSLAEFTSSESLLERLEALRSMETRAIVLHGRDGPFAATAGSFAPPQREWLELFEIPTVFAGAPGLITGPAFEVAVSCDIRVSASSTEWRASAPGPRLRRLVGDGAALRLLAAGELLDADAACACGLISAVAEDGGELAEATRIAEVIASRGPIATRLGKEAIWRGVEMPLPVALRFETDLTLLLQTTTDRAEGVQAFIEKRPPLFTGE
jgi:enoyl-CoA hydratase/carnithine racemase